MQVATTIVLEIGIAREEEEFKKKGNVFHL
jgi:hypothetical protein